MLAKLRPRKTIPNLVKGDKVILKNMAESRVAVFNGFWGNARVYKTGNEVFNVHHSRSEGVDRDGRLIVRAMGYSLGGCYGARSPSDDPLEVRRTS